MKGLPAASYQRSLFAGLVIAFVVLAASVSVWYAGDPQFLRQRPPPSQPAAVSTVPEPSESVDQRVVPAEPEPLAVAQNEPILRPAQDSRPVTVRELESDYLRTRDAAERSDYARAIASLDDRNALPTLARLFRGERDYQAREAIIAALGDSGTEADIPAKIALLATALTNQPRPVRNAALDVLGQMDDPRSLALLRATAKRDPDRDVRDAATAILNKLSGN